MKTVRIGSHAHRVLLDLAEAERISLTQLLAKAVRLYRWQRRRPLRGVE